MSQKTMTDAAADLKRELDDLLFWFFVVVPLIFALTLVLGAYKLEYYLKKLI